LLNAGIFAFDYHTTPDGWESDIQVNVLSIVLLAILLFDIQCKYQSEKTSDCKDKPHLCIVSSGKSFEANLNASNWPKVEVVKFWSNKANWPGGAGQYSNTKLFLFNT